MAAVAWHVDPDPSKARYLPPEAFTDPAVAAREAAMLRTTWQCVPDAPTLTAGERAPVEIGGAPYFLHQGDTLRGFPNVCTHAWHTLVQARGTERVQCPQHGRRFDDDGHCLGQPGIKAPDFPSDEDHLPAYAATTWGPLTFVHRGDPEPLAAMMAPVEASLADAPLDRLHPMGGEVREVAGNWKLHAGNFLDRLHIPFIHGGLGPAMKDYHTELHADGVLQWATARRPSDGMDIGGRQDVFALWWFLWPNLSLNFYPWGLSLNLWEQGPTPTTTRFHWYRWSWDDALAKQTERWQLESVDAEDVDALAQVARGVASPEAGRGRFAPGEEAIHWFHHRLSQSL